MIGLLVWLFGRASRSLGGLGPGGELRRFLETATREAKVPAVRFADIAGQENAKREVQELVDYLRDPERFRALGAEAPRGILLMGAPGTGKTMLARALAGEAGVPFFSISGSQFIEVFVGVGAARVRNLFIRLPWATHACDWSFSGPCGQITTYAVERFLERVMYTPVKPVKPQPQSRLAKK